MGPQPQEATMNPQLPTGNYWPTATAERVVLFLLIKGWGPHADGWVVLWSILWGLMSSMKKLIRFD